MIILGEKYSFSDIEYNRLKKSFDKITYISYKEKTPTTTIAQITTTLKQEKSKLIILNTQATLSPELITYLTKLEIQGITYVTIENFLEMYLQKCFISEELSTNTSFLEDIRNYTPFQYLQKRVIDIYWCLIITPSHTCSNNLFKI